MVKQFLVILLGAATFFCSSFAFAQTQDLKTIVIDPGHGGRDGGAQGSNTREAWAALEISLKLRDALKKAMPNTKIIMTRETDELPGGMPNKNAALRYRADLANQNKADLFISIHLNASAGNQRYGNRVIGSKEVEYTAYVGKGKKRKKVTKTKTVNIYEKYKLPQTAKGTQTYILARDWYQQKVKEAANKVGNDVQNKDSAEQDLFVADPVKARILASQYAKYFFQKSLTLATFCEEEFAAVGRYSWGVLQRNWEGIWVLQATQMPSILVETGFIDHDEDEAYLISKKGVEETAQGIANAVVRYNELLKANSLEGNSNADKPIVDNKSLQSNYVPSILKERKNEIVKTIITNSNEVKVSFYDNAEVDGDTISVYYKNNAIISYTGINTRPVTTMLQLSAESPTGDMVMVAETLGLVPPNTALVVIETGGKQYKINLTSTFEQNAVLRFIYQPGAVMPNTL